MMNVVTLLEAAPMPMGGGFGMILYFGVLFGIMWFLLIRPQRKRQKAVESMQDAVSVGDWVMTTGGTFGKVVDIVNDVCIVEFGLNRGVRIPVQKDQIAALREPDLTVRRHDDVDDIEDEDEE